MLKLEKSKFKFACKKIDFLHFFDKNFLNKFELKKQILI